MKKLSTELGNMIGGSLLVAFEEGYKKGKQRKYPTDSELKAIIFGIMAALEMNIEKRGTKNDL